MRKPLSDLGNEETEKLLKELEKRIQKEYSAAARDVEEKFKDYMRRFEIKDKIKREAVDAGVLKEADYKAWRQSQIFLGERWQAMLNDLSQDLHKTNEIAISTARGYQEEAYAINHNYATYLIERDSGIDTSFTLFDRQTVERLVRENPKLLPDPRAGSKTALKIAANKDLRWNRQKVSSAIMQGIIQGETVPQMAKRLESVAEMDHHAAIRNARTMVTGAQNAGRIDAGKRAADMGIGTTNVWMATLDLRTRHEHRVLDGQRREVDEPFEVEGEKIRFPGDPAAAPHLIYNCRCTLIPQVKGFEYDIRSGDRVDYSALEKEGLDYESWKASRVEKPNPITLPEEKAAAIKGSYINEYKQLRKKTLDNSGNDGIIELNRKGATHRKKASDGHFIIDKPTYNKITKPAINSGADIRIADEEWLKRLQEKNATAVTIGDTIIFRPDATVSDVLEEVFHFFQNKRGLYSQFGNRQREILCEIDAKKHLLLLAGKYHIPEAETLLTKKQLDELLEQMEKLKEEGNWQ